jgi:hypothetical protein
MTAQNVGEEDIKNVWAVLGANDIHAANMMDIDIDAMGFRGLKGIRMRPREQRERKRFRISDRRRRKAKSKKKCPKRRGPRWDSNPRGYMSKGLDLLIKEQEGTNHQATLVIGGIHFINTGIGYGQYAHSKGISAQPTELRL